MHESARPAVPRRDPAAGDADTMAGRGRGPDLPRPDPDPPPRPDLPSERPPPPGRADQRPADPQLRVALLTALSDAGIDLTARDVETVERLAATDALTATTVVRWLQRNRPTPEPDPGPRT